MPKALRIGITGALPKRMAAAEAAAAATALVQSLGMIGAQLMMMIIMGTLEAANQIKCGLGFML
ncbi:hypothetical protein CEJ83_20370 [Acinetobacter baumannii]|nr:hypothetical protein CEJ83_20370 [Acinetobacter baumannii]